MLDINRGRFITLFKFTTSARHSLVPGVPRPFGEKRVEKKLVSTSISTALCERKSKQPALNYVISLMAQSGTTHWLVEFIKFVEIFDVGTFLGNGFSQKRGV